MTARHPRKYPADPGTPVTPSWKAKVKRVLELNRLAGRALNTPSQLARAIGADKGGLSKMLNGPQRTYRYAAKINAVLHIEDAMIPNPAIERDEWDRAVAAAQGLPPDKQREALRAFRAAIGLVAKRTDEH